MSNDITASDSTTSQRLPITDQPMNPQAAMNEAAMRQFAAAAERIYKEFGLRIDAVIIEWTMRPVYENVQKEMVRRVTIKSNVTYKVPMR